MTYSSGGLIQATDYNGFVSTTVNANVNGIWSTGATDKGYGQTALATVSAGGTVTATQWASLVNTISTIASHQGTTITARTAPVTGNTISILAALNTDLTTLTTNRGNASAGGIGTQYGTFTGTISKTAATGSGSSAWSIVFSHTVTFASAAAARYFFNAGGRIKIDFAKSSTGTLADPEWNDLATTLCGDIYITGGFATQLINGTNYTGTTKIGGTGAPYTVNQYVGWYQLTTTPVELYRQYADTAPYTGQYIAVSASINAGATQLILTTTWYDPGGSGAGSADNISGGTATTSPSNTITGTAPTTLVTYIPPSTTYLTNTWGTPTIAASVV